MMCPPFRKETKQAMSPCSKSWKKRSRAAALVFALVLTAIAAFAPLAHAEQYGVTVMVRPAGAGDVYVDGLLTPSYPYTWVFDGGPKHTYLAVPKPRNPAPGPNEPLSYFSFNTWVTYYQDNNNPMSVAFNLSQTLYADFKSILGVVKGVVWDDINRNGVKDAGEEGLVGWTVQLRDASNDQVVAQDITISDKFGYTEGSFALCAQQPGTYYIAYFVQPGYINSPRHVGGDASKWSEPYPNPYPAAPAPGQSPNTSDPFTLQVGGSDVVRHAGYYAYSQNMTPDQAKLLSEQNRDVVFVDVRETTAEFDPNHIYCSLNYPLNSGYLAANVGALKDAVGLGAKIVTVSNLGYRSTLAAKFLTEYGFTDVSNMVPGMNSWIWYTIASNQPYPVANAGQDSAVAEGANYTLDGSQSSTFSIYSYTWSQVSGPVVVLSNSNALKPTFVTPSLTADADAVFRLRVETFCRLVAQDDVTIHFTENGITNYPNDVISFYSYNNKPIGVKVISGGSLVRMIPLDNKTITSTKGAPPDGMPYGIFDWAVRTNEAGGTAKVTFYFPEAQPWYYTWFKYSPTNGWSNYGDHAEWNASFTQLTLTVTDNGIGDDDGQANWIVLDPGGLGYYNQPAAAVVDNSPQTSRGDDSGSSRGCFISSLGL